jgi:hypothetical protein
VRDEIEEVKQVAKPTDHAQVEVAIRATYADGLKKAIEEAAQARAAYTDKQVGEFVRGHMWHNMPAIVGIALVLLISVGAGDWAIGRQQTAAQVESLKAAGEAYKAEYLHQLHTFKNETEAAILNDGPDAANAWAVLAKSNHIKAALKDSKDCGIKDPRPCRLVLLWLEPPSNDPPGERAAR